MNKIIFREVSPDKEHIPETYASQRPSKNLMIPITVDSNFVDTS